MEMRSVNVSSRANNSNTGMVNSTNNMPGNVPVTRVVSGNALANMLKGSIFTGDIIDVRNSAIKILLDGNQTVSARTTDSSTLNIGDYIKFQIKENNGSQILIKTLAVDNRHNNPMIAALESANIPVNERNMEMINEMMRNEMPIDKSSVNEMYKHISNFEDMKASTIVNVVRHDISLTSENITQFDKYLNYEHRIGYEVSGIADSIPDFLLNISSENPDIAKSFINTLLSELPETVIYQGEQNSLSLVADENIDINLLNLDLLDTQSDLIQNLSDDTISTQQIFTKEMLINTDEEGNILLNTDQLNNAKYIDTDTIKYLTSTLPTDELNKLISNEQFKKLFKVSISKEFSIDISKNCTNGNELEKTINDLYRKIEDKTEKLLDAIRNFPKENADLSNKINSLKSNLNFMNEINQMASYVQLPLKFSDTTGHGELYVYNKSHGKIIDKDVLTAFMHLDMDSLGATDVDIRLEHNVLSTCFTLSDSDSIQIIETHLDELKTALTEAGYSVTLNVKKNEDTQTPFEKVLEVDRPKMSIKRYSFDVRA